MRDRSTRPVLATLAVMLVALGCQAGAADGRYPGRVVHGRRPRHPATAPPDAAPPAPDARPRRAVRRRRRWRTTPPAASLAADGGDPSRASSGRYHLGGRRIGQPVAARAHRSPSGAGEPLTVTVADGVPVGGLDGAPRRRPGPADGVGRDRARDGSGAPSPSPRRTGHVVGPGRRHSSRDDLGSARATTGSSTCAEPWRRRGTLAGADANLDRSDPPPRSRAASPSASCWPSRAPRCAGCATPGPRRPTRAGRPARAGRRRRRRRPLDGWDAGGDRGRSRSLAERRRHLDRGRPGGCPGRGRRPTARRRRATRSALGKPLAWRNGRSPRTRAAMPPDGAVYFATWDPDGGRFAMLAGRPAVDGDHVRVVLVDPSLSTAFEIELDRAGRGGAAGLDRRRAARRRHRRRRRADSPRSSTRRPARSTDGPARRRGSSPTSADGRRVATMAGQGAPVVDPRHGRLAGRRRLVDRLDRAARRLDDGDRVRARCHRPATRDRLGGRRRLSHAGRPRRPLGLAPRRPAGDRRRPGAVVAWRR